MQYDVAAAELLNEGPTLQNGNLILRIPMRSQMGYSSVCPWQTSHRAAMCKFDKKVIHEMCDLAGRKEGFRN